METKTGYEQAGVRPSTIAFPANITTTEADLYKITDGASISQSQLTIYASVKLGTNATATLNYWYSPDPSTATSPRWYPISVYATSTGVVTQRQVVINSTTYAVSSVSYITDSIPMGACQQFKITGVVPTANIAAADASLIVMARNN